MWIKLGSSIMWIMVCYTVKDLGFLNGDIILAGFPKANVMSAKRTNFTNHAQLPPFLYDAYMPKYSA